MTQEQKVRTREEQVRELENSLESGIAWKYISEEAERHIAEAEARGAAEERGKKASNVPSNELTWHFNTKEEEAAVSRLLWVESWKRQHYPSSDATIMADPFWVDVPDCDVEACRARGDEMCSVFRFRTPNITALESRIAELEAEIEDMKAEKKDTPQPWNGIPLMNADRDGWHLLRFEDHPKLMWWNATVKAWLTGPEDDLGASEELAVKMGYTYVAWVVMPKEWKVRTQGEQVKS